MDGGIIIILLFVFVIGIIVLISAYIIHRKKSNDSKVLPVVSEWVEQAKASGYKYEDIEKTLKEKGWNSSVIKKAMELSGLQKSK
ncbi:MAG: hypothetical protein ACP5NZ_02145 [Nanobdellota archaeon]